LRDAFLLRSSGKRCASGNQIAGVLAKMMRKFKECRLQFDFNFRHREVRCRDRELMVGALVFGSDNRE
jgi:hypothetical protein